MIEINNLTESQVNEAKTKKIIEEVLRAEAADLKKDISVAFLGPGRMRKLNKQHRGKNRLTDVLSFPDLKVPFEKFKIGRPQTFQGLGEIVICLREVKKNARRAEVDFEKELARVVIHGTLHLLGYNHEKSEEEAKKMQEKEEKYFLMNF